MSSGIISGPVPSDLDVRLARRDVRPLPPDALLRFQLINRGKNPVPNYRWLLYADGRWFLARHSGNTSDAQTPFDTELPAAPTKQLKADVVNQVKQQLQQANFFTQPPYQLDQGVKDGGYYVVTARLDGKAHEVIYVAVSTPLTDFLSAFADAHEKASTNPLSNLLGKLRR